MVNLFWNLLYYPVLMVMRLTYCMVLKPVHEGIKNLINKYIGA